LDGDVNLIKYLVNNKPSTIMSFITDGGNEKKEKMFQYRDKFNEKNQLYLHLNHLGFSLQECGGFILIGTVFDICGETT
jgi:hypothetical protein